MSHLTKHLYIINGTMGVGKSTVSQLLLKRLDNCVFLDGDWCWMMNPFTVNDETKHIVLDNITHCINNFIHSTTYQNIILCWVIPSQDILNNLLNQIDTNHVHVYPITLICSEDKLVERIQKDIDKGIRDEDVIERAIQYLKNYQSMDTIHIDVADMTIEDIVQKIKELANQR